MELIKESDFRKEIKTAPKVGYLFFGDEDYLKAFAVRTARELICPDPTLSFFNEIKIDALDFTPSKILEALMPMPMMSERKLVTVNGLNFRSMRPDELNAICEVLEQLPSYDYNLLIINVTADCLDPGFPPKRPSVTLSKLAEYLTPVQFDRCTTAKLAAWIQKHFAHNGVQASPSLCQQMPEYCGHSMFILANEIDKLSYYLLSHGETVATEEAMRLVCIPANEYDAFAFANAIMDRQSDIALGILRDYRFRRVDPIMVLGDVTRVVCDMIAVRSMSAEGTPVSEMSSILKLHEFRIGLYQKSLRKFSDERLRRTLEACTNADASLKQSPQGYEPLERLICAL